jgi:uncharacterized membrane protein
MKRLGKVAAGGTLAVLGLRRRTIPGYTAAAVGAWLAYRGLQGADTAGGRIGLDAMETDAEAIDVERSLTVQAPPEEVRAFLDDPANLDLVLDEAGWVEAISEARQRWELATPLGSTLAWEMRREDLGEDDELAWTSTGEAEIEMHLTVEAAPEEDASLVTLDITFEPPGGVVGEALLDRFDLVPHAIVSRGLQRAKRLIEQEQTARTPASAGRDAEP